MAAVCCSVGSAPESGCPANAVSMGARDGLIACVSLLALCFETGLGSIGAVETRGGFSEAALSPQGHAHAARLALDSCATMQLRGGGMKHMRCQWHEGCRCRARVRTSPKWLRLLRSSSAGSQPPVKPQGRQGSMAHFDARQHAHPTCQTG